MDRDATVYEQDFYRWTQQQADALRRAAELRVNLPIDWELVAEEIESMGSEQAFALESALTRALEHLLKLEFSPATTPRAGWHDEVLNHRLEVEKRLRRNPGLKSQLPALFAEAWTDARRLAVRKLARDGLVDADLPAACPYTLDQVRDSDWWPDNRHGMV